MNPGRSKNGGTEARAGKLSRLIVGRASDHQPRCALRSDDTDVPPGIASRRLAVGSALVRLHLPAAEGLSHPVRERAPRELGHPGIDSPRPTPRIGVQSGWVLSPLQIRTLGGPTQTQGRADLPSSTGSPDARPDRVETFKNHPGRETRKSSISRFIIIINILLIMVTDVHDCMEVPSVLSPVIRRTYRVRAMHHRAGTRAYESFGKRFRKTGGSPPSFREGGGGWGLRSVVRSGFSNSRPAIGDRTRRCKPDRSRADHPDFGTVMRRDGGRPAQRRTTPEHRRSGRRWSSGTSGRGSCSWSGTSWHRRRAP
jgi:hypothetical protein